MWLCSCVLPPGQLQATYRKLYLSAHSVWAVWATKELTSMLRESLAQAEWAEPQRRRTWEAVVTVPAEGEEAASADAKQRVPTQTSGYVTAFLFALAQELNRIGGHTVTRVRGSLRGGCVSRLTVRLPRSPWCSSSCSSSSRAWSSRSLHSSSAAATP